MYEETKDKLRRKRKCHFTKKLRKKMTPEEIILWQELRNRKCGGLKFRRQVNIGPYIADFLCKEHGTIIELDGKIHDKTEQKERDINRDEYLEELGYKILRITNEELLKSIPTALKRIHSFTTNKLAPLSCSQERGRG
ncbi:MAG: endonuclease domain-containing protein [Candidatus Peribacteraceae bacterium]|jgi:very-short-patch-repair endonuclease|nr:hypothetical protein [Parcubacteria group bacterium]MDP6576156.1 endonuclease domain-containing protein [Candidatus Peribacteraceae bacterium]|tara:strand:+ start:204 stop:617 length:414 start_codon:yes stop_codon:yes gene_type:complete